MPVVRYVYRTSGRRGPDVPFSTASGSTRDPLVLAGAVCLSNIYRSLSLTMRLTVYRDPVKSTNAVACQW